MELTDNDSDESDSSNNTTTAGSTLGGWSFMAYTVGGSYLAFQQFGLVAVLLTPFIALGAAIAALLTALAGIVLFLVCAGLAILPLLPLVGVWQLIN